LDVSALSVKSLYSPAQRSLGGLLSVVEPEWIFEDIPKPEDSKGGTFFIVDASSSSLSTDDTEQPPGDEEIDEAAARTMAVERQSTYQRMRSSSDVSDIG
jgi:hypothetical protein